MTSIAAYLASLTGAAPQEGQNATLANATGVGGLFAALLESSGAAQGIEGENTLSLDAFGLPVTAPAGQVTIDDTGEGTVLREALTNGLELPQDGADIDAAIITDIDEAIIEVPLAGEASRGDPLLPAAQNEIASPIPQDAQPVAQPAATEASEEPLAAPVLQNETTPVEARPQQQNHTPVETHARPAALENALDRASQKGQENGLQTALSRVPQARGAGQTQQPGAAQVAAQGTAQGENTSDASRSSAPGTTDDTPAIKPGASRPEIAPRAPEIIQRLIASGNGQSIIQIQERPVGETAGASSPPTLTVSVQAPAASPGPASANAPHVPVSALAVHIAQQASNGAKRFDIRLDPPELGRIKVRLNVSREGQVMTHLVVERAETLDLLQRDARQLERALQDAGLDTSKDGMKFSLKDQGLAHGGDDSFNTEDNVGAKAGTEEEDNPLLIPDDAMPPPTRYRATSGLDIRI